MTVPWTRLKWTRQWIVLAVAVWLWQLWASSRQRAHAPVAAFFPPPSTILSHMRQIWFSGPASHLFLTSDATGNVLPSLYRIALSLAISTVISIPLGIALGRSPLVTAILNPMLQFSRSIPVVTAAPVFFALFALGTPMEVATIVSGTIWPLLLNTIDGASTVDPVQIDTAHVFRFSGWHRVTRVILPAALPKILTGFRLSLSLSLILMVFSELFGSTNGIGYEMNNAGQASDLPGVWSAIVLLGILGYVLNAVLYGVERRILRWHHGMRSA
jgi:ABC-type nitrate/sulfonate/bicarbonate transport system permease component